MQEVRFISSTQYLYGTLLFIKAKKIHAGQKVRFKFFYFVQIETTHKPTKAVAAKHFLQNIFSTADRRRTAFLY